jgi:hypothetical protein
MTFRTLSAIAILTAAIGSPVFAQDMTTDGTANHRSPYAARHLRNSYNRAPALVAGTRAGDDWFTGAYGLDHSRPGDRDPDLNPPAN